MNCAFFVIIAIACLVYCDPPCKSFQKNIEQRVLGLTDEQYALKELIEEEVKQDKKEIKEFKKYFFPSKPPKINEDELENLTKNSEATGDSGKTEDKKSKSKPTLSALLESGFDPENIDKCRKISALKQMTSQMAPISPDNSQFNTSTHPRFQRVVESNDMFYYKGEINKDGQRAGLGLIIEKPFFNIVLGNFSRGWKHGFSINVTINCSGILQYEGYEWYQGVCRGKRMIPPAVMNILETLEQRAGCIEAHAILEKACLAIPRSKILEAPEPPCADFLEDAATYRIKLHEKMHPIFVYQAGTHEGCSIVYGAIPTSDSCQEFIARRVDKNVFSFFPRHQPCKALDADCEAAKIQAKVVINTYDARKKTQMWKIIKNNDESLSFANEASGYFLTTNPSGFETYLRPMDQSDGQKFFAEQIQTPGNLPGVGIGQVVPDSLYSICNVLYGKYMHTLNSKDDFSRVVAEDARDGNSQVYRARKSVDGLMYMESVHTMGSVLNIHTDERNKVSFLTIHAKKDKYKNQLWKIESLDGKSFTFKSALDDRCIEQTCDGQYKMVACDAKNPAQCFVLEVTKKKSTLQDGKIYRIRLRRDAAYLQAKNSFTPGSLIVADKLNKEAANQKFLVRFFGNDVYSLIPTGKETMAVGIKNDSTLKFNHLVIDSNRNADIQKFIIIKNPDDTFSMTNKASGLRVEAMNRDLIIQNAPEPTQSQEFHFEMVE